MFYKKDLINDLKKMGLKGNETILIHSSMKKIGEVYNGADTVLDALIDFFKDGLLLLPTHTWKFINEENNIFDYENTPSCVGILTNLFLKRKGVIRSLHPTHSIAGIGKDAETFLQGEEYNTSPCSPDGVYDRLRQRNAKILLIGVGNERNTFIHSIEEVLNVPNRLSSKPMHLKTKLRNNNYLDVYMRKHYNAKQPHISEDFIKLDEALKHFNIMQKVTFGNATSYLLDANETFNLTRYILSKDLESLVEKNYIAKENWINYRN